LETSTLEGYSLSQQQERVWLCQQASGLINKVQGCIQIDGECDNQRLQAALATLIHRHESLRTVFRTLPGMALPLQVIVEDMVPQIEHVAGDELSVETQASFFDLLWHQESLKLENIDKAPILHVWIVNCSFNHNILFLSLPALCADSSSLVILTQQLAEAYAGSHGTEVPLQYVDFVSWQQELFSADAAEAGDIYWRKQDLGALLNLKLPFEKQLSSSEAAPLVFLTRQLDAATVRHAEELARQYRVSLEVFLQTCWHVLLWRQTGQSSPVVGTAYDGRNYEELAQSCGLFTNFLPLNCYCDPKIAFYKLMEQIHETREEHGNWQEYFSVTRLLGGARDLAAQFFYPVTFDFADCSTRYRANDVSFSLTQRRAAIEPARLALSCTRGVDGLQLELTYSPSVYEHKDMDYLMAQFLACMQDAIEHPSCPIDELRILNDAQVQQLVWEFNRTDQEYAADKCLHQLFEEQVERTPDRVALVFGDQQLTYGELERRSNQLANYLRKSIDCSGRLIGVCLERSLEMVIGLFGILKAGGAYVPFSPSYPQDRLAFLTRDIQAPLVLTQCQLRAKLPPEVAAVCLDSDWLQITMEAATPPSWPVQSEDMAYIIYTSGSTGEPKGVMIPHRGAVNTIMDMNRRFQVTQEDRVLALSELNFDLSVYDVFGILAAGGRCVLLEGAAAREPARWRDLVAQEAITIWNSVPALFSMFVDYLRGQAVAAPHVLRLAILSGDWIPVTLPERAWNKFPSLQLISQGGATEASIWSIYYPIGEVRPEWKSIPYGKPLANQQFYILDEHLAPCPVWVPGELAIGGDGLALGYWNRPGLTASQFVPHPFGRQPGERIYRTGDMGFYTPDGTIHFLGRVDGQVKIRGFRVELGEIESLLMQHPQVHEAVATVVGGDAGKRVVAYVVPRDGENAVAARELQEFLQMRLPAYMVPAALVILEAFPLTANGKVDRSALPVPAATGQEYVAPRTSIEKELALIWAQLLGVERIGIYDNFFEIGGHSLLLAQLATALQEAFLVEFSLQELFESPTIVQQTELIATRLLEEIEAAEREQAIDEVLKSGNQDQ
jgi:amino acid adenylation domain-containing protein